MFEEDQTERNFSDKLIQQQSSTKTTLTADNSDLNGEITKTFKKRPGTTDRGKDYEHFYLVHLCLKLIDDANIENFFLSSNDVSYGDFDDVILEIQCNNKIETFAVQLKHKKTKKTTARENYLTLTHLNTSDNFKVEKYFRSYCQHLKRLSTPVKMILFTNIKLEVPDTVQLKIQEDNFQVDVIKQDQKQFITTSVEGGSCHVFTLNENVSTDFKEFFEHFYLYTDQLNVDQIKTQTSKIFLDMFKCDESTFNDFVTFITNWSMIEGKKNKLDKILLQRVIALCVLTPFIKPLTISGNSELSQNEATFREVVSKFHVIRLNKNSYEIIKNLWSNVLSELENIDEVKKMSKMYQLGIDWIKSKEKLKDENKKISKILWLLGKWPLVVDGCPQVYQIIKLCHQEKFIVLDSEENFSNSISRIQDDISVFNSLEDMKKDVQIYEDILNNFTYSIEGQKEATLKNLLEINEDFVLKITTDKLLQMLNNPLLIGEQKEVLPPSHIQRTLTRILIEHEFLTKFCSDSVVIVSCIKNPDDVKMKLERTTEIIKIDNNKRVNGDHLGKKKTDKLVYISNNEISEKLIKTLCSLNSTKTVHHLRYFNDSCLEWISSRREGPSPDTQKGHDCFQELAKFRVESERHKDGFPESDLFGGISDNINIICANPGMGKTSLMKSLKNSSSSRFWTILIYSRSHSSFFRKKNINAEDFMKYIYNEATKKYNEELDVNVFKTLWKKKRVQLIWDGLDEASDDSFEAILNIVSDISKQDIKQWLTARINLRNRLEEKFHVFSRNLNKFNEDEQKRYIKDRLEINDTDELNKTFKIIETNIKSFSNNNILEIPLQIYMLTELLVRDGDTYLNLLKTSFTILDLYEHFVEEKFKVFYQEKLKLDLSIEYNEKKCTEEKKSKIRDYERIAYDLHFPNSSFKKMLFFNKSNSKNVVNEIKRGDPIGFIINVNTHDDINFEFIHNSFGEYFAALYLFEKKKSKARNRKFISNSRYNNIRFFLDLMLCAKSKAFVAVLYQNSQLLTECTEEDLQIKDDIDRDVLELSCAWSKKYPLIDIDEFKFNKINWLTTNKADDLQYKVISKKFKEVENILPLSLKKILLCLPFLIPFYQGKEEQLFNFNVLYYTVKFDLEIIFDCFQSSESLANAYHSILKRNYLSMVLACNSKRILETIMTELEYQKVLLKSLTILIEENHSEDISFISLLFQLPNISSLLNLNLIHYACQRGWLEVIKNLINLKMKIDVSDLNSLMPVHYACQNEWRNAAEIVQLLINSGTKLEVPDSNGLMPIHYACQNKGWFGLKIVQLLINSKIKVDVPDSNGLMPIHYACRNKGRYTFEIVQLLINSKAKFNDSDSNGLMPIHYACQNKGVDAFKIVQLLTNLETKLDVPDSNGLMPIHYACQNEGDDAFKIVQLLMNSKIKLDVPDFNGLMPIHYACQNNKSIAPEIVQLLINSKTKPDVPDSNGLLPIHYACQNWGKSALEIVQLLINSKTKLDVPDSDGLMPVHYACQRGWIEVIKNLVDMKVKLEVPDSNGLMPLHYACKNRGRFAPEMVELLISSKIKVDVSDSNGLMPIHYACQNKWQNGLKIVQLLINSQTKVDIPDLNGLMPIHYACQNRGKYAPEIVQLLINSGAKLDVPDFNGLLPINYARRNKLQGLKIVEILKNRI